MAKVPPNFHRMRTCKDELRDRIGSRGISFTFTRSGGPGGQNVNKVSTRATLWFDLESCGVLTEEEKVLVRDRLASRISAPGVLQVVASRHRTQAANREAATERLLELLADALRPRKSRRPTRVPKSAKVRRLRDKQNAGERKRLRSRPAIDE
jgi:ribosome-associated protein